MRHIDYTAEHNGKVYHVTTRVQMRKGSTGRIRHKGGPMRRVSEHPRANKSGYVFEHQLLAEMRLQRFLTPQEKVCHINGDPMDNRDENLEVREDNRDRERMRSRKDPVAKWVDYGGIVVGYTKGEIERLAQIKASKGVA